MYAQRIGPLMKHHFRPSSASPENRNRPPPKTISTPTMSPTRRLVESYPIPNNTVLSKIVWEWMRLPTRRLIDDMVAGHCVSAQSQRPRKGHNIPAGTTTVSGY
jgi:hypothetical protein